MFKSPQNRPRGTLLNFVIGPKSALWHSGGLLFLVFFRSNILFTLIILFTVPCFSICFVVRLKFYRWAYVFSCAFTGLHVLTFFKNVSFTYSTCVCLKFQTDIKNHLIMKKKPDLIIVRTIQLYKKIFVYF